MTKQPKLLWVDLEMTGLDPAHDRIMELGAIVTDWEFRELATFEAVVNVSAKTIAERMVGEFWEKFPEVKQHLVAQNAQGKSAAAVEREFMAFLSEQFDAEQPILLAGNSIHQDRKFIDNEWPDLAKKLHYRMLDVSAWKIVFEGKYKKKFAKPEAHRAMDDIRGSIEEMQYYLGKVRS